MWTSNSRLLWSLNVNVGQIHIYAQIWRAPSLPASWHHHHHLHTHSPTCSEKRVLWLMSTVSSGSPPDDVLDMSPPCHLLLLRAMAPWFSLSALTVHTKLCSHQPSIWFFSQLDSVRMGQWPTQTPPPFITSARVAMLILKSSQNVLCKEFYWFLCSSQRNPARLGH